MRITRKKTVTKEIEVTTDVLCNKCGKTCSMPHAALQHFGLIEAEVSGGFDSTVLEDLHTYTFSLCEVCLKELFSTFKIHVQVGIYSV
jgi:hypothetical protein